MMSILKDEIKEIKKISKKYIGQEICDERAFMFVILKYYCFNGEDMNKHFNEADTMITDGAYDGGIDFLYYDDDTSKVVIAQSKYTNNFDYNDIITELTKMSGTVNNFINYNTGWYNVRLRKELQNLLDLLPDNEIGNVEYSFFTISSFDEDVAYLKINNASLLDVSIEMVNFYMLNDIESKIESSLAAISLVEFDTIKIDEAGNGLKYSSETLRGIMVNISSESLIKLFNKYSEQDLFDLNIRKFIRNKLVDIKMKETLDKNKDNFWFLNNGVIIACADFEANGDTIKLSDFSIVNGGQTTNIIGKYKGRNNDKFFIPCKIIAPIPGAYAKEKNEIQTKEDYIIWLFTQIAEATNSQKPIQPRDLRSNSLEMKKLQSWLLLNDIYLEIKRGEKRQIKQKKIRNDELAQLILSLVQQKPGTARSSKKSIFVIDAVYNSIFHNYYYRDLDKQLFIVDLIDLNERYSIIVEKFMNSNSLFIDQLDILKNGKQIIFAILGILYSFENSDISPNEIMQKPAILKKLSSNFKYSKIIGYYQGNDLETLLEELIKFICIILADTYKQAPEDVTSVSNFFKSESRYYEDIIPKFMTHFLNFQSGKEVQMRMKIFHRK
ncbi:MAG: AIPR family protein [Mobilitalea sp.]